MNHKETTIKLSDDALEQAAEWVVRLNDPRASEDDFSEWQQWLAKDAEHVQAFHEVQDAWQRASAVADVIAAPTSDDRVTAAGRAATRFKPRWSWALSLAATVLIVCGVVFWPSTPMTLSTTTAELRSVKLPDGSRVSLGPETQLRLSFTERERLISMQSGEAYFEVSPDPQRPFSVKTPTGTVVAVGTAFSVHTLTDRIAVAVTHGKVRVETGGGPTVEEAPTDGASASIPVVLVTGQRFVREGERTTVDRLPSLESATAWQQRRLEYNNEELRVVIAHINRYSATKLTIDDSKIGELRYTGTVFPDEIDVWLESIEGVFPIRIRGSGSNRAISTRE